MDAKYYNNDSRIIKIEPNPFKKPKQKIKMKVKRMNGTQPITNQEGRILYKEEEPQNLTRIPGTTKTIVPMRTVNGIKTGLDVFVFNLVEVICNVLSRFLSNSCHPSLPGLFQIFDDARCRDPAVLTNTNTG